MEKSIKILMVDDEEQFRETTSKILRKKGYQTTMAASGEEAVTILEKTPHDVVILDIQMGGMDGHEALKKIKEIQPTVRVIMLTGHGNLESAKKSLIQGADDYLNKPCDMDLMNQKIRSVLLRNQGGSNEEKLAKDLMIQVDNYTRIQATQTVTEALQAIMKSIDGYIASSRLIYTVHRSVLVYQEANQLVGILSVRHLIEALRPDYLTASKPSLADSMQYSPLFWVGLFTSQARNLGKVPVSNIMSNSLIRIDVDTNLMEIANLMSTHKVRRVVVMENKNVVGIVREQELFFEMTNILL